ncbi:beta-ketoacyl-ACP synthase III [Streptomyces lunalinharesii]|uniref:Beta-ketoacyl-ACP synthase III n=1 Tax=Streptomyces lunalinharesii TaxID=333384 RepID=A0ABP6E1W8_9ACTN
MLEALSGFVPPHPVHNTNLPAAWGVDDQWVQSLTGVITRYHAGPGQATSDLAFEAARRVLDASGGQAPNAVLLATSTPDRPCPATAPLLAARLGMVGVPAFDLAAVCTGFIYALAVGQGLITAGTASRVLVVAADIWSTLVHPDDRSAGVVLGDGAGAVLLRAGQKNEPGALLGFDLGSDGTGEDLITIRGAGARERAMAAPLSERERYFTMAGFRVFQRAVTAMTQSTKRTLTRADWLPDQLNHLVPHQANSRILAAVAERLGIPTQRVITTLARTGNTGVASIPLALADAAADNRLSPGERVVLTAFGGGLTWGSAALYWPNLPATASPYPAQPLKPTRP